MHHHSSECLPVAVLSKKIHDSEIRSSVNFVPRKIEATNACFLYQDSKDFDAGEFLSERCLDFICCNAGEVFKYDNIKVFTQASLLEIVNQDHLNCESESAVYGACFKWAELQCPSSNLPVSSERIRELLGPVLYAIRFPLMGVDTLSWVIGNNWVLSPEEKGHLFTYASPRRFTTI